MEITIILSSVRDNRLADSVFTKVKELIGKTFDFNFVDPKSYPLPLLNKRYFEMKDPDVKTKELHTIFSRSDGFIIITPEYNHCIPPVLSNMLDHFGEEFKQKSCGIVSYSEGAVGGARAGDQLRLLCSTLGMPPIPISPAWGVAHKANLPEGKAFADNFEKVFGLFLKQFMWYTEAFKLHRERK